MEIGFSGMPLVTVWAGLTRLTELRRLVWLLPPGTAIAIVAFITVLMPTSPTKRTKRSVTFACLVLVALEIALLTHARNEAAQDRKVQDSLHKKEMASLVERFTAIEQLLTDLRTNAVRAHQPENTSSISLKKRALDLSDELLQFLVNRQIAPRYGQGGFGEGGFGGTDTEAEAYQKQTVEMYAGAFQTRVIAMRDAFAKHGLKDIQLDSEYKSPANAYSIRTIAERIGAVAEKLPQ
jgi:hypothetical protein